MVEFRSIFSLLCILFLSGCSQFHYLLQASGGQLALLNHARPIKDVLKDEKTPPRIKVLLSEIEPIKRYGEKNGLKATSNYKDFVKLDRSAAVWVVSACEVLKFKSKEWSFPIVGSFPYLGWFDIHNAEAYQKELQKEGWDVDLRGAAAYSTLGWFPDAVLSTMIPKGDEAYGDLVNVVIHESVHASVYVNGQAYFNESLASFVADGLTRTYLDQTKGPDSIERKAYDAAERRSQKFHERFYNTYLELNRLYDSSLSDAEKLQEKQRILTQLRTELQFKREINNATLIQFKTYNTGQKEFERILKNCDSNWIRFLAHMKQVGQKTFSKPQQDDLQSALQPYIQGTCPKL